MLPILDVLTVMSDGRQDRIFEQKTCNEFGKATYFRVWKGRG